jgi:carboxymethylenebutenolidase
VGHILRLTSSDGHTFDAYHAPPVGERRGGLVVVQEVFGVNAHIRAVCDRFAGDGFEALAPALFDRLRPGVSLDYDEAGITEGRELVVELGWDKPLLDIEAAANHPRSAGKVGVVGYCWGGSVTFLAGCRLDVDAAVVYYGRHIVEFLDEKPRCPMMMHFGEADPLISLDAVAHIGATYPDVPIHVYEDAGHGFNCERRADFRPEAAERARRRSIEFFRKHLA